jgi:hypothetical protein
LKQPVDALLAVLIGLQIQLLEGQQRTTQDMAQLEEHQTQNFERHLARVESQLERLTEFEQLWSKLSKAALKRDLFEDLLRHASGIERDRAAELVLAWAEEQVKELGEKFNELNMGTVRFVGANNRFLIDHLIPAADGGIDTLTVWETERAFWRKALAKSYIAALRNAKDRGVTVRRIYVYEKMDPELEAVITAQKDAVTELKGLQVNLVPADWRRNFILCKRQDGGALLYDYELVPGGWEIANTVLHVNGPPPWRPEVLARRDLFESLVEHEQAEDWLRLAGRRIAGVPREQ